MKSSPVSTIHLTTSNRNTGCTVPAIQRVSYIPSVLILRTVYFLGELYFFLETLKDMGLELGNITYVVIMSKIENKL